MGGIISSVAFMSSESPHYTARYFLKPAFSYKQLTRFIDGRLDHLWYLHGQHLHDHHHGFVFLAPQQGCQGWRTCQRRNAWMVVHALGDGSSDAAIR